MQRKEKTTEEALSRLMALCARSERCVGDVQTLLFRWGIASEAHPPIVERLCKDGFVDDRRYARAYVRDKLRFSGWGPKKIEETLRRKKIDRGVIRTILQEESDDTSLTEKLRKALRQKLSSVHFKNRSDLKAKLVRFGMSRGYDYDLLFEEVDRLLSSMEQEKED